MNAAPHYKRPKRKKNPPQVQKHFKQKQPILTEAERVAAYREAMSLVREQVADRRNERLIKWGIDTRRRDYAAYMRSPEWTDFRLAILAARGTICEKCGIATGTMQVHHLHYRNLGCEKPEDVRVVCLACHKKIHEPKE